MPPTSQTMTPRAGVSRKGPLSLVLRTNAAAGAGNCRAAAPYAPTARISRRDQSAALGFGWLLDTDDMQSPASCSDVAMRTAGHALLDSLTILSTKCESR